MTNNETLATEENANNRSIIKLN